jgi:hypothetical protein
MPIMFRTPTISPTPGLPEVRHDASILPGDNGGVRFAFDLAFPYSWPTMGLGTNGALVRDTAEVGDGSLQRTGSGTVYSGGGFKYASLTGGDDFVQAPSGCLSSIWADSQFFLVCGWYLMPTQSNWRTGSGVNSFFHTSVDAYTAGADLVTLGESINNQITARRQTNGSSTIETINLTANSNIWGQVCQVGYWRNAAGTGLRVRSALGQLLGTGAVGANNTGNFSATQPKWGATPAFNSFVNGGLYRGFIEDLRLSTRNPIETLDKDFTGVMERVVFS